MLNAELGEGEIQGTQPHVGEIGQRLDANCSGSTARSTQCVCMEHGPEDNGGVSRHSLHRIHFRKVPCSTEAFRSLLPQIPGLGGCPGALWGTRGVAALTPSPLLGPHLGEAPETALFFLGPFSPSLLRGRGIVPIKRLASSKACNKRDASEFKNSRFLFHNLSLHAYLLNKCWHAGVLN